MAIEQSQEMAEDLPSESKPSISLRESLIDSGVVILFVSIALTVLFRLWTFHPRIPIHYDGDGLPYLGAFRNFQEHTWYFYSSKVGYPFGQHLQDFPAPADGFSLTISWILVKVLRDPVLTFNVFFFLTYPITAVAGYFGARMLTLNRVSSIAIGVLFAFVPFHTLHGAPHLYLSMYPIIPIVVGVVFREVQGLNANATSSVATPQRKYLPYVLLGLAASISGLYFAFFSLIFFGIGILFLLLDGENLNQTRKLVIAIGSTIFGLILQSIPIISYQNKYGSNLGIVKRTIADVEGYPLRLIDLLLPVPWHRIDRLANFSGKNRSTFVPGEANAFLGIIGAVGVVILLIVIFSPGRDFFRRSGLQVLSRFSLFFLLASSVGGFNQILASIGFTQIRVWARSAIFIAFIAISASFMVIEWISRKFKITTSLYVLLLSTLVVVGLWDTNRTIPKNAYEWNSIAWHNDQELVQKVESTFGAGARVVQLPILKFPEQGPVEQLTDYAQIRGSLHSRTLCWSYGVVSGRDNNRTTLWQALSPSDLVLAARAQGFDALWLELRAYPELGVEQTRIFTELLGQPVLTDDLKLVQVFDLRTNNQNLRATC